MSYSDIQQIPSTHFNDIFLLMQHGVLGWAVGSQSSYQTYVASHNLQQTLVAVNSSKKYKFKTPEPFEKLFPTQHQLMTMGRKPIEETVTQQAISFLSKQDMPDHIKKKLGVS